MVAFSLTVVICRFSHHQSIHKYLKKIHQFLRTDFKYLAITNEPLMRKIAPFHALTYSQKKKGVLNHTCIFALYGKRNGTSGIVVVVITFTTITTLNDCLDNDNDSSVNILQLLLAPPTEIVGNPYVS